MDFHSMKRKDLQRLCKKHGIQANLKNVEMAERLSSIFKEENSAKRGSSCLKSDEEEVVSSKESKRVKFSSENETFWFEKTDPREMRLMARNKRGFRNSAIEQNPVSVAEEVVQNDGNLDKRLERKSRRRSVLVKCDQIFESKIDEKPVTFETKLRRGSVVVKCDQISESNSVDDHVEKPVRRSSRRKSTVVKTDAISDPKIVDDDDFEKSVGRNLRRKSVVVEADHISESKMNDEKVEEPVQRTRRKSVVVEADKIFESKSNDEKVEKPAQRTRRKSVVVEADQIFESKSNDEKVEKPAQRTRRKSVAVKSDPSLNLGIVVDKVEKPVKRASMRNSVVVVKSDLTLDSKNVVDKVEKPAKRASSRRSVAVGFGSDQNIDSKIDEVERESRRSFVESENVNSNIAVENNVQEKSSEIAPDIKKGKRRKTMKTTRVKRGRKVVAEIVMQENVDDETVVIDKTHDDVVADVQILSNISPTLPNCGDGEPESSIQANKVAESSSLNIVADKNSYEEDASAPPSLLRIQFSDALVGSTVEHNIVGELMCQSTTKPSLLGSCAVGDAGGERLSGSLSEIKSAMTDRDAFESSDGLECHQSKNEQLVQQESWFEKSPCLGSSLKNENAVEVKSIDCAAGIVEEPNVQTTEQDEATGLWGVCESIVREIDQKCEFSVDQQSSHLAPGDKTLLVSEADTESKVQTAVVEGVIPSPNASGSTQNKLMEEGKDINTITLMWNQEVVSCSSGAEAFPVVQSLNKDDDVVDSLKCEASECVSVAGKTKYLEQRSVDAAEDMNCNVSCSNANFGNFEDRGAPEVSHSVNNLVHLDVGNTHMEPTEDNDRAEETITAADKLDIRLKDDDKFAESKLIPQKDIIHRLETLCDNHVAQSSELTVVSGSVMAGRHEGIPNPDHTCFSNDEDGGDFDGKAKYVTVIQPEEANCFVELESLQVVSGDDKDDMTNDARSEDLEFKRVTCTAEDLLALGGEVDESVMSQERKLADLESERNTIHYDVYDSRNVSDQTKDFELNTVDDAAKNHGEDSAIMLQAEDGELAETLNVENATSSGGCISSSNAVSENSAIKETVYPVSKFGVHFKDDKPSADLKSNSCNNHLELMEIQTPRVLHAQDSSPDVSQEKTDLNIKIDNIAAQETESLDSIEDKMKSRAQETGYVEVAEGVGTWGIGSPESTFGNMLDEEPAQGSSQHAKLVGSVKKESVCIPEQTGYVEGATEVVNSAENESFKSNSEREVGEELEMEPSVQNNKLATVSESSKRDARDEISIGLEHSAEQGKHIDSCGSPFEMADKSGSPMRTSGNFSLRNVASGSDNVAGSLIVDYPSSMDTKSICYFADVYAPTCEIASESLQPSQVNICNETLLNACISDVDELHSGEPILSEDNQDNKAEMVEPGAKISNATPPESKAIDNISLALVNEIHDGPECIGQDPVEYANTKEMELQGVTSSPFSAVNWKLDDVKGNDEPRDNVCSAMVESLSFGENEKGSIEYAPEEQMDNHMNAPNRTRQVYVNEEQEEDDCTNVNYYSVTSWSEDVLQCDIGEVLNVNTIIVHEKFEAEAELDLNVNEGNCMSGEQIINQEHMDPMHTDAYIVEKDHSEVNGSGSLERSPSTIFVTDSAAEHIAQSEIRGSGYSVEKEAHIKFVASPESLIRTHEVLEHTISQNSVNTSGAHEMTQECLSGCSFTLFEQEKDSVCCMGNSEADINDDVTALSNSKEEDGEVAEELFSRSSERRIERETNDIDGSDNAETDSSPPFMCQPSKFCITDLLENEDLKSSVLFTDSEIDYLCCGEWETAKVEVRERQSVTPNAAHSVDDYDITELEYDTVSTHQPANEMILEPENLASGEQEQRGSSESKTSGYDEVLMSSVIQRKNFKNYAEDEDMKSNTVFTDSEIELLWGETTEKDEVGELQTEASDDTCPVNEYNTADVENDNVDTCQLAVEKILEPQNLASEEHKLGDGKKGKGDFSVDPVHDVKNHIDEVIQRKNERSILIHATPKKVPMFMNDMKENTPAPKRPQMVDVTATKPSLRRKALQKID